MTVRTRIAPSPTGIAHIGTAYMALFNYAFARQNDGEFLVRIEDTDRARFVEGAEQVIYDSLDWLEIPYTKTFRQSEHLEDYSAAVQTLIQKGHAYYCFCTPERLETMRKEQQARKEIPRYDRLCTHLPKEEVQKRLDSGERHVIRMKMPDNEMISWDDLVRGTISINTKELDDQVLMKSDGFPTYHLAVVVDDNRMQISHVIRGEEWISSTPKHILLYRYFGWQLPVFAHMPLLRNVDKTKMSKRKNDVSIPSYKEKGYLPQALRNYLCLMGWSHPDEKDIFALQEFIKVFSFSRMQTTGPIFDVKKLDWMNGKYIREVLKTDEVETALFPFLPDDFPQDLLPKILPLVRERLVTLHDIGPLTEFFYHDIHPTVEELMGKKSSMSEAKKYLEAALSTLEKSFEETEMLAMVDSKGWNRGAFFTTLRVAVTGRTVSPPLFDTIRVLGKQLTLSRVKAAITLC
ncbi:MAG TPA: glutamate--tRNA ligase [Patescibacteria group bacterium]|nr:glutamate--tRNA ligase [Patescibacteria group bacterium]